MGKATSDSASEAASAAFYQSWRKDWGDDSDYVAARTTDEPAWRKLRKNDDERSWNYPYRSEP